MVSQVGDSACIDHNNNTELTRLGWHSDRLATKRMTPPPPPPLPPTPTFLCNWHIVNSSSHSSSSSSWKLIELWKREVISWGADGGRRRPRQRTRLKDSNWKNSKERRVVSRAALKRLKSAQRGVIGPVGLSQRPVVVWQPKSMVTLFFTRVSHIALVTTIGTGVVHWLIHHRASLTSAQFNRSMNQVGGHHLTVTSITYPFFFSFFFFWFGPVHWLSQNARFSVFTTSSTT